MNELLRNKCVAVAVLLSGSCSCYLLFTSAYSLLGSDLAEFSRKLGDCLSGIMGFPLFQSTVSKC